VSGRYSEQQIQAFLEEVSGGLPVADLCARLGISERTYYRWKERSRGGVDPDAFRRLEDENRSLRRRLAEKEEDVHSLISALVGRYDSIEDRRRIADGLMRERAVSERHACELTKLHRSTKRYRPD
jgi:putative transposase